MFRDPRQDPSLQQTPPPADESPLLRDLRVFHNAAREITSAPDRESVIRAIMAQMQQAFRPESWSLLLVDDARQCLVYAVNEGRSDPKLTDCVISIGEGMAGWVAAHGEPLIVPQIDAFARAVGSAEKIGRLSPIEIASSSRPIESAISMPLQSRSRTLGVLQLFNYRLEALTDYAITFLHILSDYAAIAIENVQATERIQQLTITDDSTGLFNTRHLHATLQSEFERSRRFHTEFSVIFIDLDRFKHINDTHGHIIGTEALVEVARLLQHTTRAVDSVFRYGGDEFVVLLPQTTKEAALEVAQRLRDSLRSTLFLQARALNVQMTASFGVSTYPHDGNDPASVLQTADTMMYSVKHGPRDDIAGA